MDSVFLFFLVGVLVTSVFLGLIYFPPVIGTNLLHPGHNWLHTRDKGTVQCFIKVALDSSHLSPAGGE